eukprot:scaffold35973_cov122-Skeletonema_dohrnii-CCMP3373.AAC.2
MSADNAESEKDMMMLCCAGWALQKLQHKKECKKRAAEFRDELLFKQPESCHEGDCPICLTATD